MVESEGEQGERQGRGGPVRAGGDQGHPAAGLRRTRVKSEGEKLCLVNSDGRGRPGPATGEVTTLVIRNVKRSVAGEVRKPPVEETTTATEAVKSSELNARVITPVSGAATMPGTEAVTMGQPVTGAVFTPVTAPVR